MSGRSLRLGIGCVVLALSAAGRATASEPAGVPPIPLAAIRLNEYLYVDFPRQLTAVNNEIALAERTVAVLQLRVQGYRPFRSFHQYGATFNADQLAQLDLLVAYQRLECVQQMKDDLWRQRQAIVGAFTTAAR